MMASEDAKKSKQSTVTSGNTLTSPTAQRLEIIWRLESGENLGEEIASYNTGPSTSMTKGNVRTNYDCLWHQLKV